MMKNTDFEIEIAPLKPFDQGSPKINGPKIYGASPKRDFLYYIPIRGERPLTYSIDGTLPPGLSLNVNSGIISGQAKSSGEWTVKLQVENRLGRDERKFKIVIRENGLCLTPLLGWASWNAHGTVVTDAHIRKAAEFLRKLGLADRGYAYVNIDSGWQGIRPNTASSIIPNKYFPDMYSLTAHIHRHGLKAGIYSTPMVQAWGNSDERPLLPGSTGYPLNPDAFHPYFGGCGQQHFEEIDARQWAAWKFDYLKYDWPLCDGYYTQCMSEALRATGRDFVFSITTDCDLKYADIYRKHANMFRANKDTYDEWYDRLELTIFPPEEWLRFTGPGTWYDMDMLALGHLGLSDCEWNRLSRNEMISHMAVWAFMASPIQIGCNLEKIDDFTLSLLSNEELIDINQDELGCGAELVSASGNARIYRRKLADGSYAAAFINASDDTVELSLEHPGQTLKIRDILACRELGTFSDVFSVSIPIHGTRIIRYHEQ